MPRRALLLVLTMSTVQLLGSAGDACAASIPVLGSPSEPSRLSRKAALPGGESAEPTLADRLVTLRGEVVKLESDLLAGLKFHKNTQSNIKKIQALMALQHRERELGKRRLGELEATVLELEARRSTLSDRIRREQRAVRRFLTSVERSTMNDAEVGLQVLKPSEREKLEAPRRKVLAALADRGLKEIEALKVDIADAEQLEARIQDEKQQLAYLFQDLLEQEGILELNRQLQVGILRKKHDERIAQLESYRKLKTSEMQVERLIGQFNARRELERETEAEREANRVLSRSHFARLKGRLPLPVAGGKVVSSFGRGFDPQSRLYIFRKGIDISAGSKASVKAISAGKIAYSGDMPSYGRVAIIDHGEHFYSLCAHLGELKKKAGDPVAVGDTIGLTEESGTPVYFEIRARNVAVNPLQWVSN